MPRPQAQEAPYSPASLPEGHIVVRLGPPQGSGNFVCSDVEGKEMLVELPNKVRRVSFAARGMFAFVQLFESSDSRLAGEITHVISGPEIKAWRRAGEWPKAFDIEAEQPEASAAADDDSDDDSLPENPNRRRQVVESESESDEESDDE